MGYGLLLLLLLAAGAALYWRQRQRQRRRRLRPRSPTLFSLELGDLVQFEGHDWVVENRLEYDEDGFRWLEYLLRDGKEQGWLSVEEDDWLELGWYQPVASTAALPTLRRGIALPASLEWEGREFRLTGEGKARLTASLRALRQASETCRYGDYEAEDGSLLALELWGSGGASGQGSLEPELALGRRLDPGQLALLPGDGRSVYRAEAAALDQT
jgi:hypothetical protein